MCSTTSIWRRNNPGAKFFFHIYSTSNFYFELFHKYANSCKMTDDKKRHMLPAAVYLLGYVTNETHTGKLFSIVKTLRPLIW